MCTYTLLYNDSRCALLCVRIKNCICRRKKGGVSAFAQANCVLKSGICGSAYIFWAFFVK